MNNYARLLWLAFFAMVIAVGLLLVPGAAKPVLGHPSQIVDSMSVSQLVNQSGVGSTFGFVNGLTSEIIGGQREVTVTVEVEGTAVIDMYFQANVGVANNVQAPGVRGKTILVYDGTTDGGAPGVDPGGLGTVNLEAGGDTAFVLLVMSSDQLGSITITYYSHNSLTRCSSLTKQIPSGLISTAVRRAVVFPYSQFSTGSGCSLAADKTQVGAIVIEIDGTAEEAEGWDVALDFLETNQIDLGDLPTNYNDYTLLDNGAAHVLSGTLRLGSNWDAEADGQQETNAVGDDNNGIPDDEDGVVVNTNAAWTTGTQVSVTVTIAGGNGCLSAWIDWTNDGDFLDPNERVINNDAVIPGSKVYTFTVPSNASGSGYPTYFSRWRLFARRPDGTCPSTGSPLPYNDSFNGYPMHFYGGEVEDHRIGRAPTAVTLSILAASAGSMDLIVPLVGIVGGVGILGLLAWRRRRN